MRILLVKPEAGAIDFGLAPFFQTEPLGLMYVASALRRHGHEPVVADLRFDGRSIRKILARANVRAVGISCVHILDAGPTAALADAVKQADPTLTVIVGGHAASMYPPAITSCRSIDAIALGEGEVTLPRVCDALADGRGLDTVPGLLLPAGDGAFAPTAGITEPLALDQVALPDRASVAAYQKHYCCLNYMPVWTVETARGCESRCRFCSVWEFHHRTLRFHALDTVRADFQAAGPNIFVVDDTFWSGRDRSLALAGTLKAAGIRKNWLLVQSRLDTVVEQPDLLEAWRPLAKNFDIFFGFEAPTSRGLQLLNKDADVEKTVEAVRIARKLGFGITGNFIIDPDSTEEDFHDLWAFLEANQLSRVGFTILQPLPGTRFYEQMSSRLEVQDWSQFDLHHLLWKPRLPVRRFFELYCESWRRSVLNLQGQKKWWRWLAQVRLRDVPRLARILSRTQRLMDPDSYIDKTSVRD